MRPLLPPWPVLSIPCVDNGSKGVIQPIVVRPIANNQYEIIAGERRWRAAQLAELTYIPAIIRDITDETAMLMALIENIQRRDLNVFFRLALN